MMERELHIEIWRGGTKGRYETFAVPDTPNQTVLDIVTHVQREIDPTLSYRFSCRVGMCGSCAMMVNGVPRWTCRTHVARVAKNGRLKLAPLKNLPVIRDLATDMTTFFDKWQAARGHFVAEEETRLKMADVDPRSEARISASEAIECINCAVCYAACDVVSWNTDYLGPAALNRAWAAANDVRDADGEGVLTAVAQSGGCLSCHTHQSCAAHCPVGLNPTRSIAGLKRLALKAGTGR